MIMIITYVYIYIYVYLEREREREREISLLRGLLRDLGLGGDLLLRLHGDEVLEVAHHMYRRVYVYVYVCMYVYIYIEREI